MVDDVVENLLKPVAEIEDTQQTYDQKLKELRSLRERMENPDELERSPDTSSIGSIEV